MGAVTGHVVRVNGPLVDVEGLQGAAMSELVELGPLRLLGEVVALDGGRARTQAYEYTGGLAPGAPVRRLGHPLSAGSGPACSAACTTGCCVLSRPPGPGSSPARRRSPRLTAPPPTAPCPLDRHRPDPGRCGTGPRR